MRRFEIVFMMGLSLTEFSIDLANGTLTKRGILATEFTKSIRTDLCRL